LGDSLFDAYRDAIISIIAILLFLKHKLH